MPTGAKSSLVHCLSSENIIRGYFILYKNTVQLMKMPSPSAPHPYNSDLLLIENGARIVVFFGRFESTHIEKKLKYVIIL